VPTTFGLLVEEEPWHMVAILECLTPKFSQHPVIPTAAQTSACLQWLGKFHGWGLGLQGMGLPRDEGALWRTGGHTSLVNRPADELQKLPDNYRKFMLAFSDAGPEFVPPSSDLGQRLHAVAHNVDSWINEAPWQVLIHGDFKSGNIFVQEEEEKEVCVIDWQWTGFNIGAQDLVYFLSTSVTDEAIADPHGLMAQYHEAFVATLPSEVRNAQSWPLAEQERLFKLALLDYMRWALSYRLPSEIEELRAQLSEARVEASQASARANSAERLAASAPAAGGTADEATASLQRQVVELSQEVASESSRARKAEEELARTMASFVEATRARLELQRRVEVLHEKLEAESARCKQMVVHSAEISEYFAIVCKKAGSIAVPLLEEDPKA